MSNVARSCQFQFLLVYTINKFHENGGGQKKLFIPPQSILEGNGVVYRNFTFNSLLLQVFTSYLYTILFKPFSQ